MRTARILIVTSVIFMLLPLFALAQDAPQQANSNSVYQQLRNIRMGKESVTVANATVRRDVGTFQFRSGAFYFLAPVQGKVTGAVFLGDGSFILEPTTKWEKKSVSLLTKENSVKENFNVAVFRFTDGSYEEFKGLGTVVATDGVRGAKELGDNQDALHDKSGMRYNLSARILRDLLSGQSAPGLFYAFLDGKRFGHEVFALDPQGVEMYGVEPEEVAFATCDETTVAGKEPSIWYAGHQMNEYDAGTAKGTEVNAAIDVLSQKLDVKVEKSAMMSVTALTTVSALRPGVRVASFTLFRNFKVQSVTDAAGHPLEFIKEEKSFDRADGDDAGNFSVILPKPLAAGEQFTIKSVYGGKEAITNEGNGNYYPVSRHTWYPASRSGDYVDFEITLRVPKGFRAAATGSMVSDSTEGDHYVSNWRGEMPMAVAGFSLGSFKIEEGKLPNGFVVQSFANTDRPNWVQSIQHGADHFNAALGTMSTVAMMKLPLEEGQIAMQIFGEYFGPITMKRLAITQQTACNYGQAWPGLVWLPICSFFDSTVRHELGIDDSRDAYWEVVTPHEVAHQWWGHEIGWASYRDQWMSEGFAEFSASLFIQNVNAKNASNFLKFWRVRQENIQFKNQYGFRYSEVGPVTMGMRANNSRSGLSTYNHLVYPKGAYVLHMLRMLMADPKTGDAQFKAMMRDFVQTYRGRAASTEDFKKIVEKHMLPSMDLEHNHQMDWFFNDWVYGTDIPNYTFTYNLQDAPDGNQLLDVKLVQDGVGNDFLMRVPLYAELANGAIVRLGGFNITGNDTVSGKVNLGKNKVKRAMINYQYDVLAQVR